MLFPNNWTGRAAGCREQVAPAPRDAGFSLLETLITLAIVSIVTSALFGALGAHLQYVQRLERANAVLGGQQIAYQRFRDAVAVARPIRTDNSAQVFGSETDFEYLDVSTPERGVGRGGLRLVISADQVTLLRERSGQAPEPLNVWPGAREAHFEYLHRDGRWRSSFDPTVSPPDALAPNVGTFAPRAQKPLGVALVVVTPEGDRVRWSAADPVLPAPAVAPL
jgi:prepilin-type N-terminal cleavage/methylation domain-containing protein